MVNTVAMLLAASYRFRPGNEANLASRKASRANKYNCKDNDDVQRISQLCTNSGEGTGSQISDGDMIETEDGPSNNAGNFSASGSSSDALQALGQLQNLTTSSFIGARKSQQVLVAGSATSILPGIKRQLDQMMAHANNSDSIDHDDALERARSSFGQDGSGSLDNGNAALQNTWKGTLEARRNEKADLDHLSTILEDKTLCSWLQIGDKRNAQLGRVILACEGLAINFLYDHGIPSELVCPECTFQVHSGPSGGVQG